MKAACRGSRGAFGNAIHVSGTDAQAVAASIESLAGKQGVRVRQVAPGLEDVFIHLTGRALR